ncbi:17034_t:CDS:2, partial [Gigaspora margarita]
FGNSEVSCRQLLGQLASYKLGEPPFDETFEPDCQTLQMWWKALDDVYDYLSTLAIKILKITPYLASLEALAKIHQYYTTHAKEEISYINYELTLEDILNFKSLDDILNLEESFDLNNEFFGGKSKKNNNKLDNENVVEKDPNYNYD